MQAKFNTGPVGIRLFLVAAHTGRAFAADRIPVLYIGNVVAGASVFAASRQAVDISNAAFPPSLPGSTRP